MTRKSRDTSKKRQAILDAAISTFIENGYEGTSMDMVAENSGSSKRTVYNHFASKEALIEEVFNQFIDDAFAAKEINYDPELSIEKQLGEFADSKIQIADDPKRLGLMRMTLGVFVTHPHMTERAIEYTQSLDDGLEAWLTAANQYGKLKIADPKVAAETFWSLFSGTFFWPAILEGPVEKTRANKLKLEYIKMFMLRYQP